MRFVRSRVVRNRSRNWRAAATLRCLTGIWLEALLRRSRAAIAADLVAFELAPEKGAARWKILGNRPPLASRAQNVHDPVHDLTHIDPVFVAAILGGREVTRISQMATPSAPKSPDDRGSHKIRTGPKGRDASWGVLPSTKACPLQSGRCGPLGPPRPRPLNQPCRQTVAVEVAFCHRLWRLERIEARQIPKQRRELFASPPPLGPIGG